MKLETARKILETAEGLGLEIRIYEGYSGRGMYGEQTTGITGDRDDIETAVRETILAHGDKAALEEFMKDTRFRWDSLGHDSIAY